MKSITFCIKFLCILIAPELFSQSGNIEGRDVQSAVYRRSSIYTLMLDDAGLVKADIIKSSFEGSPVPDKFNDHNLTIRSFNPLDYPIPEEMRAARLEYIDLTDIKSLVSYYTGGLIDTTEVVDLPLIIGRFLEENRIAKGLVAKWFNRDENGFFNMDLVAERGEYNASEMQAEIAEATVRGRSLLADAGKELIYNTFVVVSRFNYVSKEEIMAAAQRPLDFLMRRGGALVQTITSVADLAAEILAEGYVIQTSSYLYKLRWNDSIAAVFFDNYWMDQSLGFSKERKLAFENTNLFQLEFVGFDRAWASLQSTIFTQKTEYELIRIATIRAIDAVIAKLQREHDVFKTKAPLYTINPLSAKIGLKEGVTDRCRFEVLEKTKDENGRTKFVRKGVIRVDDQIWDNRYMADEEREAKGGTNQGPIIDRTFFRGSGNFFPGMLIRQVN